MPRAGVTVDRVVSTAADLADRDGADALTLSRVADELGVRTPSLYSHIDGLDDLLRRVAVLGVVQLGERCRTAAMGTRGAAALAAIAGAYRAFAGERPGVYLLTQAVPPDDPDHRAASQRLLEPVLAALAGFGLEGDDAIHAARSIRSALHGFVLLEQHQGFGLEVDVDTSFAWMIRTLTAALETRD